MALSQNHFKRKQMLNRGQSSRSGGNMGAARSFSLTPTVQYPLKHHPQIDSQLDSPKGS